MDAALSLGHIIEQNPLCAPVLERHELDYCAKSETSLQKACLEQGLSPEQILIELSALGDVFDGQRDWHRESLCELADFIEQKYHQPLRQELATLSFRMEKVCRVHGSSHEQLKQMAEVLQDLSAELRDHMNKEERILFPWIRNLEDGQAASLEIHRPISIMEREHEEANQLLSLLRTLTGGYQAPVGACGTFRALYAGLEQLEKELELHRALEPRSI